MDYQPEDVTWADAVLSLGGVRCIKVFHYIMHCATKNVLHAQVMGLT